jgi:hypothetical protein
MPRRLMTAEDYVYSRYWSLLPSAAATNSCVIPQFLYHQQNSCGRPAGLLQPGATAFPLTCSRRPAAAAARRPRVHWGGRPALPPCTAVSTPPLLRGSPPVHGLPACRLALASHPSPAPKVPHPGNSYPPRHISIGMMCVKCSASFMGTWLTVEDCETYVALSNAIMLRLCSDR